jgi:hypothetical protein
MSKDVVYLHRSRRYAEILLTQRACNQAGKEKVQIEDGENKCAIHQDNMATQPGHGSKGFTLNLADALTPDPGTEDMFKTEDNTFAFSPGHL